MKRMNLIELMPRNECIAVIGGGGKTGFLTRLEEEFYALGRPHLVSVTTRLARHEFSHLTRMEMGEPAQVLEAARRAMTGERILMTGPDRPDSIAANKYEGLPPNFFAPLAGGGLSLLLEADGSAGRPLKAHREGEPPLPALPAFVVAILGLSALTLPACRAAHRPEELARRIGPFAPERPLSPARIADFAQRAWRPLNPHLIFLNQWDALTREEDKAGALELAALLRKGGFECVMGSLRDNNWEKF